ncbi:MAG TPA: abortive phage infection protein [Clostridiales bacterium]|nr:abortive phage infection protein [Clostridiales bacterium]
MNQMKKLVDLIDQNKGLITTGQVEAAGVHRKYLSLMAKEGEIDRLSQGIYLSPKAFEDRLYLFQIRSSSGIYSHETALFLHGLSDREPITYMMTVPTGYNAGHFKNDPIKIFYIKSELHKLGKSMVETSFGRPVRCYDRERTLCDLIRSRSQMEQILVNTAIKKYLSSKEKNVSLILCYANELGILKIMQSYLEVLL